MFENKGVSVEGDKKCALKTETLQMDYQDPVSSVVNWVCKNYPAIHNLKKAALALRDKTRLATVEDYDKYVTLSGKYIEALRKGIEVLRRKVDRDEIMPSNEALLKKGLDEAYASQLKRMSDLTKSSKGRWLKERQMSNELDEAEDVQCATNNAYGDAMDDICEDLRRSFNKNFRNIDEAIRYMYKDLITDTDWTEMFRNRAVTEDMILDFCFANGSSRAYDEKYTCERLTNDGYSKAEAKKATSKAYKDFEQKCKPYAKKVFALYKKLQNERQMSNEQDERELQCANTVKFGNGKYSPRTPRLGQKTSEKRRTAFYAEMTYQDMLTDIKNPQRAALKFKEWVHEYGSRYHINENSKPDDVVNAMVSYYCTNTTPDYSIGSTIGDAMRGKNVSLSELGVTREERDEFNRTVAKWRATTAKVWSDYVSQSDKKMSNDLDDEAEDIQCARAILRPGGGYRRATGARPSGLPSAGVSPRAVGKRPAATNLDLDDDEPEFTCKNPRGFSFLSLDINSRTDQDDIVRQVANTLADNGQNFSTAEQEFAHFEKYPASNKMTREEAADYAEELENAIKRNSWGFDKDTLQKVDKATKKTIAQYKKEWDKYETVVDKALKSKNKKTK